MRVTLPSGTAAELALPDGSPTRGVVLCPDVGGLRPLFDDLCARLALDYGWAVCAVEPFPDREHTSVEERLSDKLDHTRVLDDLVAAADLLSTEHGTKRVAVTGFCMGGMFTLKAAGTGRFDRAAAFYGMIHPPDQWSEPGNDPLDALRRPEACPTLAVIGGVDRWTPQVDVEELEALPEVTVARYAEADHGFVHDPSRPAHRANDAADAWARVTTFFA